MKKILISLALSAGMLLSTKADNVTSGTLTTPGGFSTWQSATTNVFLISTNRMNIHRIQLSSTASGVASLYNSDNTNSPFFGLRYTNDTYVSRGSYTTNLTNVYVGANGFTNIFTNSGVYTFNVTNSASTNLLNAVGAFAFTANTIGTYDVDILCERGLVVQTTTNVNYVLYYTTY